MSAMTEALVAARAALAGGGSPGPQVLTRTDGAPAVAFLVTLGRRGGELVLPLRAGANVVARGQAYAAWPKPEVLESAQWIIDCHPPHAEVRDNFSTNCSVLVPATMVSTTDLSRPTAVFAMAGAQAIPHPNTAAAQHRFRLGERDVLCSVYAVFAFGWV